MKKYFILISLFLAFLSSSAQILEPVKWEFSLNQINDKEAILIFKANIDDHWHLYSQNIEDGGPIPTGFFIDTLKAFEFVGKVEEKSKAVKEFDKSFKMELTYFNHEAVFEQKINILTDKQFVVKGFLEFMVCDDERCLPPSEVNFEFSFNENSKVQYEESSLTKNTEPNNNDELSSDNSSEIGEIENPLSDNSSIWILFWFSFVAGLIAILTPCVFPMIPMTVSFFMNNSSKAKGRFQAIVYGASIIAIYTIIGTIVAVTLGANFANWLSTHWLPNILFFLIFMIFAASFLGMFEITLPSWIVNKSDQQVDRGGISGSFFMAFTLVLVSFSCTGPIVGAILVKSASGDVLEPIVGMFGFSLAFALPFTLFAMFPSWLSNLPKSGGWLNSVKVVLGFIEIALGLKFLSIADQTYHWGILDREIYLAFWIIIFLLMGVYLLGKLKFAHDSDLKHLGFPRLALAIITFTFVLYLIPGMFGAPLKALSGYLPPQSSHDFDLNAIIRDNARISGNSQKNTICDSPKYHKFLHLPHGLEGYFDYEQGLACAKEQNKPIFIDFTGHGCVNCREMEANVWSDPSVLQRLNDEFVVIALYVDDKTKLPEKEWIKSSYDGKMKKTIGKIYADFQISQFNVNAQPYYVLLDNKGDLSEPNHIKNNLLTKPRAYNLDIDLFVEFLDKGLEEYKKRH